MGLYKRTQTTAGKITISILVLGFVVFSLLFLFDYEAGRVTQQVIAQELATTTITVLNTPPLWTSNTIENPESSTSTPTNATSSVTFAAVGTDSNNEDYFLIVCKTSVLPTPNADAPPTCDGGVGNQWAISATTTSGATSTAVYATLEADAELNDWYGWICDFNTTLPRCNLTFTNNKGLDQGSPFHVNHRPVFTAVLNDSPTDPGVLLTWTSTSSDADTLSSDTVTLYVCSTQDFDFGVPGCTGTLLASTTATTTDVSATTTIAIPTQDATYNAYVYVIDNHDFGAIGGSMGSSSNYTVNNVAPTVSAATMSLNGGSSIVLTVEQGETTGVTVDLTFADNNSCVANGSTTSEFLQAAVNVYRSGITQSGCDEASEYNANHCYAWDASTDLWAYTQATSTGSCSGPADSDETFQFVFPLWYIADPTDGSLASETPHFSQNWLTSVQVVDDDSASSTLTEVTSGVELLRFLAFDLNITTINYGSLEPGNTTTPIIATTTIESTGNTGLDEALDGEDMCTDYTGQDTCFDPSPTTPTSTILVGQQVYATSSIAYTQATALSSTSIEVEINVASTTVTTTPATGDTIWGIAVPASIILSGNYEGQNTFIALTGEATDW